MSRANTSYQFGNVGKTLTCLSLLSRLCQGWVSLSLMRLSVCVTCGQCSQPGAACHWLPVLAAILKIYQHPTPGPWTPSLHNCRIPRTNPAALAITIWWCRDSRPAYSPRWQARPITDTRCLSTATRMRHQQLAPPSIRPRIRS
jgi:hypothetical protein